MQIFILFTVLICSLVLLNACERDFICHCEKTTQTNAYGIIEQKYDVTIQAKTRHDAFRHCHDMDYDKFGDYAAGDTFALETLFCDSYK